MKGEVNFTTWENFFFPFSGVMVFKENFLHWKGHCLEFPAKNENIRYKMTDFSYQQLDTFSNLSSWLLSFLHWLQCFCHLDRIGQAFLIETLEEVWNPAIFLQRSGGISGVEAAGGGGSEVGRIIVIKCPWILKPWRKQRRSLVLATANHSFQNCSINCVCVFFSSDIFIS